MALTFPVGNLLQKTSQKSSQEFLRTLRDLYKRGTPPFFHKPPMRTPVASTDLTVEYPEVSSKGSHTSLRARETLPGVLDNLTIRPPDTMGSVGHSHIVLCTNQDVLVREKKSGKRLAQVTLQEFIQQGPTFDPFDPRIFYDKLHHQWLFSCDNFVTDGDTMRTGIVLGATIKDDPVPEHGFWRFTFVEYPFFGDYPSLGYDENFIVVTTNDFPDFETAASVTIVVYDRPAALTGDFIILAAGTFPITPALNLFGLMPAVTLDKSDGDRIYLAQTSGEGLTDPEDLKSSLQDDIPVQVNTAQIFSVRRFSPELFILERVARLSFSRPWMSEGLGAPQKNSPILIDTNDDRVLNVVFREKRIFFVNNLFLPVGTTLGADRLGFQVVEVKISEPLRAKSWWLYDPTGENHYGFPSVAVNKERDFLIGYTLFGSHRFASAGCAFLRHEGKHFEELEFKKGQSVYNKTLDEDRNRWGDYSATVVDPDDSSGKTFWTFQEIATVPSSVNPSLDRWDTVIAEIKVGCKEVK